ncbi:MAG: LysE family transporter, partial [bacterium]
MFIKGFIIGFSIAAPIGPIGLLCVKRTLIGGRLSGLFSGLGAAACGICYGTIAAMGITSFSNFLITHKAIFQCIGGLFLCGLGLNIFLSRPNPIQNHVSNHNFLNDFLSTFFLTIVNPLTILSFIAVFTSLEIIPEPTHYLPGLKLVLGLFIGEMSWWIILSFIVGFFRKSLTQAGITAINKVSGAIIIAFGCWAFWGFLKN